MNREDAIIRAKRLSKNDTWSVNENDASFVNADSRVVVYKHCIVQVDGIFSDPYSSWEKAFIDLEERLYKERRSRIRYLEAELEKAKSAL